MKDTLIERNQNAGNRLPIAPWFIFLSHKHEKIKIIKITYVYSSWAGRKRNLCACVNQHSESGSRDQTDVVLKCSEVCVHWTVCEWCAWKSTRAVTGVVATAAAVGLPQRANAWGQRLDSSAVQRTIYLRQSWEICGWNSSLCTRQQKLAYLNLFVKWLVISTYSSDHFQRGRVALYTSRWI